MENEPLKLSLTDLIKEDLRRFKEKQKKAKENRTSAVGDFKRFIGKFKKLTAIKKIKLALSLFVIIGSVAAYGITMTQHQDRQWVREQKMYGKVLSMMSLKSPVLVGAIKSPDVMYLLTAANIKKGLRADYDCLKFTKGNVELAKACVQGVLVSHSQEK